MSDENEEAMLRPPCEFGRFIVERELGHGGMGGVYLARDKMLDRQVALKVMLKSLGSDPQFLERFRREAQAAARLIHPSIAQIYSYDIVDGQPYIAMEMAGGGSLYRLMEVHGRNIDPTRVMRVCKQVAEGLSCAADQGLVHGDIKPENILFDSTGAAKIVDFGLAGMQDDNQGEEIWGTPYYIAPEKVRKGATDFRVDMYSLGATIYHAITGVAPFEGEDPNEVVKRRFLENPRPPSAVRPGLPASVDRIILRMIAREAIDRYPTWEACIGDINRALADGVAIDDKAAAAAAVAAADATAPAGDGASQEQAAAEAAPSAKGGRRLMMKGRRKKMFRKGGDAGADEPGNAAEGGDADDASSETPAESEAAEDAEGAAEAGEEKPENRLMKFIMLGAIGIVVVLLATAGGLVWYIQASKAAAEQQRMALMNSKVEEAKAALRTTMKSATEFASLVSEQRRKSESEVRNASDAFLAMLDPAVREACRPVLVAPETKDYVDAVAYSNKVAEKIASLSRAAEPPPAAPEPAAATNAPAAKAAATNAPAAKAAATNAPAAKAAATNAPAAKAAATNAPAAKAAATNAPAAKAAATNAPAAKADAKKAPAAKADAKKAPAKPSPKAAPAPAPAADKPEAKVDLPPQLKAFQQLWTDLWTLRAAEIRVNACLELLLKRGEKNLAATVSSVEDAESLAKQTGDLVEEYEAMKALKVIEQALKKAAAIRQKAPTLVSTTRQQIERARARAAKLAAEKAAAEAAEAAKRKAEEEYRAKAEAEAAKAQERYDALAARELRRLDWSFAMRQMGDMTNGFEKLTREGARAVADQVHKIRCMQMLQNHFIKRGKGFEFSMGKYPKGTKIAATDGESLTLQRPTPRARSLKDRPVAPKPEKLAWRKFYFEQPGMLNNMIIALVQDRSAARVGLKEWSNLMFGAALTMSTLFPDEPTVPARVEELVNRAVEEFENCQKLAERLFPKVFEKEEAAE